MLPPELLVTLGNLILDPRLKTINITQDSLAGCSWQNWIQVRWEYGVYPCPSEVPVRTDTGVYRCLYGRAPRYLADHLIPASNAAPRRRRLRSANLNRLTVPRCQLSTYTAVGRSTALARHAVWNSLPDE